MQRNYYKQIKDTDRNDKSAISRLISLIRLIFDKQMRRSNVLYSYRARVLEIDTTVAGANETQICAPGCRATVRIVDRSNGDDAESSKINNLRNCTGENLVSGDFVYVFTDSSGVINSQNSYISAII